MEKLILSLQIIDALVVWLDTSDHIAQRLIKQGKTEAARALGQFWLDNRREGVLSNENLRHTRPDDMHSVDPDQINSIKLLLPHRDSLAAHLLAIVDDTRASEDIVDVFNEIPASELSSRQLHERWGRLSFSPRLSFINDWLK